MQGLSFNKLVAIIKYEEKLEVVFKCEEQE
jgi:hypothetical protein